MATSLSARFAGFSAIFIVLNLPVAASADDSNSETPFLSPANSISAATPIETDIENVGRAVDVREQEEFEHQQNYTLTDVLQNVSGVRMFDIGGPGAPGLTPIEVRGFQSRGTQLLLNGMALSDPSSVSGTFDNFFGDLTLFDVSSVEVVKGGAGVLYGSDAQAGAINLILKRPTDGFHADVLAQGGSFDTFLEGGSLNYGTERAGAVISASQTNSQGLVTNGDYNNTSFTAVGEAVVLPDSYLTLTPIFRLISTDRDINTNPTVDESGALIKNQSTDDNRSDTEAYVIGLTARATPSDRVEIKSDVFYLDTDRKFFFNYDGFESKSTLQGTSLNADSQVTFNIPEINSRLSLGGEYEHQGVDSDAAGVPDKESRDQVGAYLFNQMHFFDENVQLGGGARISHISDIDSTLATLEASTAIKVPWTASRLHSSIAQGFRAPTLFESKGKTINFDTGELEEVGNRDLEEEESTSWDVGLGHPILGEKLSADVTYFQIDADQTILFDFANSTHVNGGGGETAGFEVSLLAQPLSWTYLRGAYTHLEKADGLDSRRRQRTPRDWFAITGAARVEQLTLSSELRFRSSQEIEFYGVSDRYEESGATVVDAAATYSLCPATDLFVKADNIFDEKYTEAGFSMPRASVYGGLRFRL